MTRIALAILALFFANPAVAQQQQAGTATDTDAAFQALVDACDDVDALMLRARIRLQLPRTTEEAAETAREMLRQGFQTCADGDPQAAKEQLTEALRIAEEGTSVVFGAGEDSPTNEMPSKPDGVSVEGSASGDESDRAWWKFW